MSGPHESGMRRRGRFVRRPWFWVAAPLGIIALACWWLTVPLDDTSPGLADAPTEGPAAVAVETEVRWPDTRLEGEPAKRRLLDVLRKAESELVSVESYTATFRKQERLRGTLQPLQTLQMKVRNHPFAVYLKFVEPQEGKEVIFAEGLHDNKVIAHGGGITRLLVPRLAVAPDHPLALADSRHPITDAGLLALTRKLIRFRELDLTDPEAETILETVESGDGVRYRSIHHHPHYHADRPFMHVEVEYDPETLIPVRIRNYQWPEPGQAEPLLAEHYSYDDLVLHAGLTGHDFDLANAAYGFRRF